MTINSTIKREDKSIPEREKSIARSYTVYGGSAHLQEKYKEVRSM